MTSTARCKEWGQLPAKARNYLRALAELTAARLTIVSVGPAREQTIFL
jgi:adenylosuccinate synthase